MPDITDIEFRNTLEEAIKKCRVTKALKRTPAIYFIAEYLHVRPRQLYKWLGNETSPHDRDTKHDLLKEFIRKSDSLGAMTLPSLPPESEPTVRYSVNSVPVAENLTIPILPTIPFKGLAHVSKEEFRGEVSIPRWMIAGGAQDYYALELRGSVMDSQAGDLAIIKRQGDICHTDWVVVGETHGYSFVRLSDLVANKDRFTISGVVAAIFHKIR
jgi:SOS-response transcriptional repressor LexA